MKIIQSTFFALFLLWTYTSQANISVINSIGATLGQCNGQLTIEAEGTAGSFIIDLLGPAEKSSYDVNGLTTFSNLCPGDYTVQVINAFDCVTTLTASITGEFNLQPNPPHITSASTCETADGAIEFDFFNLTPPQITGGNPPYTWTWSTGSTGYFVPNIYDLLPGLYTLTITDNYGWPSEYSFEVESLESFSASTTVLSTSPGLCDGSISLVTTTSAFPIHVILTGGGSSTSAGGNQSTYTFSGLCTGSYSLQITDANNCSEILDVEVSTCTNFHIPDPEIVNASTCTNNNGLIDFGTKIPSGGTAPYSFNWSNGGVGPRIENLEVGVYYLTISDVMGCTLETHYSVNIGNTGTTGGSVQFLLDLLGVEHDLTASCVGSVTVNLYYYYNSGYPISLSIEGEGISETYEVPQGFPSTNETHTFSGLCGGNYTIIATYDPSTGSIPPECNISLELEVLSCPGFTGNGLQVNKPSDCSAYDGAIIYSGTPAIIGGTPPYGWMWSTGATNAGFIDGLTMGVYAVTIVDANGCRITENFDLNLPNDASSLTVTDITQADHQNCDGSISVEGLIGTTIRLFADNGYDQTLILTESNYTFGLLCMGNYTLHIEDLSSCQNDIFIAIHACPLITLQDPQLIYPTGCESTDGVIKFFRYAEPEGGVAPYEWVLVNENGAEISTDDPGYYEGLGEGIYTLLIKDALNCTASFDYILQSPATPQIDSYVKDECENLFNGAIYLIVYTPGAEESYSYTWSNGTTQQGGGFGMLENLETGPYGLTVTNTISGCTAETDFFVGEILSAGPFERQVVNINASCPSQPTGGFTIECSGGNPPYYVFTTNGTVVRSGRTDRYFEANDVFASVFSGIIRDDCDREISLPNIIVPQYPKMELMLEQTRTCADGQETYGVDLTVSGTANPTGFVWSNGFQEEDLVDITPDQTYSVTVTDENGCWEEASLTVVKADEMILDEDSKVLASVCRYQEFLVHYGYAKVRILNAVYIPGVGYKYKWDSGEWLESTEPVFELYSIKNGGLHKLEVMDACGQKEFVVGVPYCQLYPSDFVSAADCEVWHYDCAETRYENLAMGLATPSRPAEGIPGDFEERWGTFVEDCKFQLYCQNGALSNTSFSGTEGEPFFRGTWDPATGTGTCEEVRFCQVDINTQDPDYYYEVRGTAYNILEIIDRPSSLKPPVLNPPGVTNDCDNSTDDIFVVFCQDVVIYKECVPTICDNTDNNPNNDWVYSNPDLTNCTIDRTCPLDSSNTPAETVPGSSGICVLKLATESSSRYDKVKLCTMADDPADYTVLETIEENISPDDFFYYELCCARFEYPEHCPQALSPQTEFEFTTTEREYNTFEESWGFSYRIFPNPFSNAELHTFKHSPVHHSFFCARVLSV